MTMMNYFILTAAERAQAMGLDDDENVAIDPRAVDNASLGTGINLNDIAANYQSGDPVTLTGAYVAPKRIVDDPAYQQYCPNLITFLLTKPWALLENETIFAPVDV